MDLHDVQGLVFHAYRGFPHAAYLLLTFKKNCVQNVQQWLTDLLTNGVIDSAKLEDGPRRYPNVRVNVALSASGLTAIGLDEKDRQTFPVTFLEGLGQGWTNPASPDHRSRILGDVAGNNRPSEWEWGYQPESRVDGLLLIFANDEGILWETAHGLIRHATDLGAIGDDGARILNGAFPPDDRPPREPFGFVDGISQPVLRAGRAKLGRKDRQPDINEIEDGEIVLGYRDNTRMLPRSPSVAAKGDRNRLLRDVPDDPGMPIDPNDPTGRRHPPRHDLGYNGTYLVFRQLEQDVAAFNNACQEASENVGIPEDRFKALVVGRWQKGSPIMKCPNAHDPALEKTPAANDFGYRSDPNGERCPIGSHIRRANPRDSLGDDPEESLRVTRRHRILRRGRPYEKDGRRGLHFICLNADIARQFEFIQQNWINDATFGGLDGEDDPLVGARVGRAAAGCVTLPPPAEHRVHARATGLAPFVTVKGGGYFFLPGLTALRFLAGMEPVAPKAHPQRAAARPSGSDRLRQLFLSRFPILLAAVLALAPLSLAGNARVVAIVRPVFFLSGRRDMLIVSTLASLAAAVAFLNYRNVQLYANRRFGVVTASPFTLKWRHVWAWQLISLPIVFTALWMTASDATDAPLRSWAFVRQLGFYGASAAGGYAMAFLVLFLAAAARERTVRPDYPEGIALLPASRLLRRFKSGSSPIVRPTSAFVRYVETHAATWPLHRGAGYVDHGTGRILPGHLAALALFGAIVLIYSIARGSLRPPVPAIGFQLPPLAYMIFLLFSAAWTASAAAFFLDRYRFPVMTALGVALLLAVTIGGTDHEFAVVDEGLSAPPSIRSAIMLADSRDRIRGGQASEQRPIVVVAVGGGGLHQAAWTTRVLTGLTDLWGKKFSDNLRLVSAVSGGSVGSLFFLNAFTSEAGLPREALSEIVAAAGRSVNGDVWWGFAYPDLRRALIPFPSAFVSPTNDRGWALEQGLRRSLGLAEDGGPTMNQWRADVANGWRPAVAFNVMVVETGQRAVLATYGIPGTAATQDLASVTDRRDLSAITAARLSASFPYISPFSRAQKTAHSNPSMNHLADGGYWDNHAVVSAVEWLTEALPTIGTRKILFLQIPPLSTPQLASSDQSWVWQQIAPLAAFDATRTNAQETRNDLELTQLQDRLGKQLVAITLPFPGRDAPLSWHLSRRERSAVEAHWRDTYLPRNSDTLRQIACVLGPDDPGLHLPVGCPQ
jgi:Dyp-type peroxidase family